MYISIGHARGRLGLEAAQSNLVVSRGASRQIDSLVVYIDI
jgi:hypothetical protein